MTSLVDKAIDQLFRMNDVMIIEKSPLGERIPFPVNIAPFPISAKCPICGSKLLLDAGEACEQDDNGEMIATEIQLHCTSEPDIDSPEWDEWHRIHYSTPYIDWLPLDQRILRAVRMKYYFED